MTIWSAEIKDLVKLWQSFKGLHPILEKELEKLISTSDENMVLVYARRCLEVIITDLSERELKRPRGTEPLKGLIDRLNKEEKIPFNITVSMQNLNSLSTFGAHPKDFDPRQVKPVILDLTTIIDWYLIYSETLGTGEAKPETAENKRKVVLSRRKGSRKPKKGIILISSILLICIAVVAALVLFNVIGGGKRAKAGPIESVVVLPFDNFTGDDQLEYFVSGMHSSLITDIGKISGLRIICKTSSNAYKNADIPVREIASELNVDAVIEADVMCLGDSICVRFKLISAFPEEKILWTGDFKEEKNQILQLYNRVTKKIANEIRVKLTPQEEIMLTESKTVNTEAYDDYMKGQYYLDKFEMDALEKATEYFNSAIQIDPGWAPPYAGLAEVGFYQMQSSRVPPSIAIPKIYINLNRALELDPNSANSHYVKAFISVWTEWNWEKGEEEFLKAIELNPSHALSRIFYAHLLMILHRSDEALEQAKLALELDPMRPLILGLYGEVLMHLGYYQEAITQAKKAISIEDHSIAYGCLQQAYYALGEYEKSFEAWKHYAWWNDEVVDSIEKIFHEQGYFAAIEAIINVNEEVAQKGGQISVSGQANRYLKVKKYDKALDYLEKGYSIHDANTPYIALLPIQYKQLKDNPRFIELLKKMNLPL